MNSPGKQQPNDGMDDVSPLFPHATEQGTVCRRALPSLLVGTLGGMCDGCWFDTLVECILRVDYLFFAPLFGEGGVVVMSMLMLVCWIQHGICRDFRFLIHDGCKEKQARSTSRGLLKIYERGRGKESKTSHWYLTLWGAKNRFIKNVLCGEFWKAAIKKLQAKQR